MEKQPPRPLINYNFHITTNRASFKTINGYLEENYNSAFEFVHYLQAGPDSLVISLELDRATRTHFIKNMQAVAMDNVGTMVFQLIKDEN